MMMMMMMTMMTDGEITILHPFVSSFDGSISHFHHFSIHFSGFNPQVSTLRRLPAGLAPLSQTPLQILPLLRREPRALRGVLLVRAQGLAGVGIVGKSMVYQWWMEEILHQLVTIGNYKTL